MLRGLDSLNEFNKSNEPSFMEFVYYLFWDKGISLKEFNELPIPYIIGIISTHKHVKKEEEKAYKKK